MTHTRNNEGVCSVCTTVRLDGDTIQEVSVQGGCNGNLKGVCSLLQGCKVEEAITRMEGIRCGEKNSSCPNEIAKCLREAQALR